MEHSVFGASGMSVVALCPGSVRMVELFRRQFPELANQTNPAAEEGTCAHEGSEFVLRMGVETSDCVGMTFNGREFTEVMATNVAVYVSKIRQILSDHPDAILMIEKRVTMYSVAPDVFGTGDCIIYIPSIRKLHVIDLKYGYAVVNATDNIQLAHYSVSTLDTFQWWDSVDTVEATIIQPRADHVDGVIRTHTFSRADLIAWQQRFTSLIAEARKPNATISAGENCKYCEASPICRARIERTMDMAGGMDAPLETLTEAELLAFYNETSVIVRQCEKVKEVLLSLAKSGKRFDGLKLVKAVSRHRCSDEKAFIKELGLEDNSVLYNRKLKGKTDLKKLKSVDSDIVDKYFPAPPESLTLAKSTDPRPAYGKGGGLGRFTPIQGHK